MDDESTARGYEEAIKKDLEELQAQMDEIGDAALRDQPELYRVADASRLRLKTMLKALKTEVKGLSQHIQLTWAGKVLQYEEQLDATKRRLKIVKAALESEQLLGAGVREGGESKEGRTTDGVLRDAHNTATDTTKRLEDIANTISKTTDVATATATKAVEDTERIARLRHKAQKLDEDLGRSNKLISRFMRRLYTDKVILAFTFVVVMTIGGIIAYASLNPNQTKFNVPKDAIVDPQRVANDVDQAVNMATARRLRGHSGGIHPTTSALGTTLMHVWRSVVR